MSLSFTSFAQVTFQRTFGSSTYKNIVNPSNGSHGVAFPTSDGGYAAIGCHGVSDTDPDMMLVKMNSDATTHWVKTYTGGSGDDDFGYTGAQTSDGGYILAGEYGGFAGDELYIIKTTSDGTISWTKQYAGSGVGKPAIAYSIEETSDGGYIIGGSGRVGGPGNFQDMYMVKIASDGSAQWTKSFSGTNSANDYGFQAIQTADGGYAMAGQVFNGSNYDVFLVKTASDGTLSWSDQITLGASNDIAYAVTQTTDGGYALTGSGTNNDLLIMKVDNTGAFSWAKTYDPSSTNSDGRSIQETTDGGFIVAGSRSASSNSDIILLKTTSDGTLEWCKYFAGTADGSQEYGSSARECSDGGFILSGYVDDQTSAKQILFLAKTDSDGMVTDASCSATASVVPTVTSRTGTVVNTATATASYSSTSTGGTASTPTITVKNFCSNSNNLILPVEMVELSGQCIDRRTVLQWTTASETNNQLFAIERSHHSNQDDRWEQVGTMTGAGTVTGIRKYEFVDELPFVPDPQENTGSLYYRLKQTDFDGQYEYFGPLSVRCKSSNDIELHIDYNMLINGVLECSMMLPEDMPLRIEIFDLVGRSVSQKLIEGSKGYNKFKIDLHEEAGGFYLLACDTPFGRVSKRFMIH